MRQMFDTPNIEAVILVDVSIAFNLPNRQNALRNIQKLCPPLSNVLINTYREEVQLFIDGETVLSEEDMTQGDLLAMAMYAVDILPLIKNLSNKDTKQVLYADDSAACGALLNLRFWWDLLTEKEPRYGYHPNASKTWLIVKKDTIEDAKEILEILDLTLRWKGEGIGSCTGNKIFY